MNAVVTVRRALTEDRAFIRDLGRRVAMTSVSSLRAGIPERVTESYDQFVDFVLLRDHAIVVATDGGRPIGFVMVIFDLPDEVTLADQAFVAYIAVEPERQRHGAGRALLAAAESLAVERGLPHLSLMVTEDNARARSLFDGAGFSTERRLMTKPL